MSAINIESYPPPFRQHISIITNPKTNISDHDNLHDNNLQEVILQADDEKIPEMDFQNLNLEKLREACKNWGIFRLINHGIPETVLNEIQDYSKKLFSLSFEYKSEVIGKTHPISYFWGSPALTSSGDKVQGQYVNWVEGFNVPLSQISQFQAQDTLVDSFRLILEEYGKHLARIGKSLFEVMAANLNLNAERSKFYLSESTGFVRIYRYPQCSMANETQGMEVHTDSSVLSILSPEPIGGLEIFKNDKWIPVKPIPNTLIINLGDMMQAISDDEYKSVKHRVKVRNNQERLSTCYFVFPEEGSVIQSSKYKPFSYQDFQKQVQQDMKTVGFKVGLERFKIIDEFFEIEPTI